MVIILAPNLIKQHEKENHSSVSLKKADVKLIYKHKSLKDIYYEPGTAIDLLYIKSFNPHRQLFVVHTIIMSISQKAKLKHKRSTSFFKVAIHK